MVAPICQANLNHADLTKGKLKLTNFSSPRQSEKVFAAIAHICVILPFWGTIGAIGIWATQKERSPFIGFQALQAVFYQLIFILFGFCLGMYTFVLTFYLLIPPTGQSSDSGILPLWISGPSICGGLFLLGYIGYGLWAAVSVLRGREFRYWMIGPLLAKRFL